MDVDAGNLSPQFSEKPIQGGYATRNVANSREIFGNINQQSCK